MGVLESNHGLTSREAIFFGCSLPGSVSRVPLN
jgi:hypothetical protein